MPETAQGSSADEAAGEGKAAEFHEWNHDAQDQVSALLGQSGEDSDASDDLAMLRKALADQNADSQSDPEQPTGQSNQSTENGSSTDQPAPKKRLRWLSNILGNEPEDDASVATPNQSSNGIHPDAIKSNGQAGPDEDVDALVHAIDEILGVETPEAGPAHEAEDAEDVPVVDNPEPPADVVVDVGPEPVAPLSQEALMGQLFKDQVAMALLNEGIVTFPQAMQGVQSHTGSGEALWRSLAAVPGVDTDAILRRAATVLGIKQASLGEMGLTVETVQSIFRLFPLSVCEGLVSYNLLPIEHRIQPNTEEHSLVIASPDPSNPDIQQFVKRLGMPVELLFASGKIVRGYLKKAWPLEESRQDDSQAEEGDQTRTAEAQDSPEPAKEEKLLDLSWEPFDLDGINKESDGLEWKSLAELSAEAEEETPSDQSSSSSADIVDTLPNDDLGDFVSQTPLDNLEQIIEPGSVSSDSSFLDDRDSLDAAEKLLGDFGLVDDSAGELDPSSFDGSPVDLPDSEPVPDISDWIKRKADESEPTDESELEEPAAPKEKEQKARPVEDQRFEAISDAEVEKVKRKDRVIAKLLDKGAITIKQVKRAQWKKKEDELKDPLWRVLTQVGGAPRDEIFEEAATVYAFKKAVLGKGKPDPDFARSVVDTFEEGSRDTVLKLKVVPFEVDLDHQTGAIKVVFITHDPTRPELHRLMRQLKLERFELQYAPEDVVRGLIAKAFPRKNEFLERMGESGDAFDLGHAYDEKADLIDEDMLEAEISRSKLINLFEATLVEAVRQESSDIHIWPNAKKQVEIHFRIDGRLQRWHVEDKVHPEALTAVIKDNSMNVDRFERDAAQDGFIQRWIDEALIRFRVSVLPIANAASDVRSESIVIRVLDDRKVIKDLRKLGLHELSYQRFRKAITQPHGMVILTGPTGSGKTTTLYASLHEVVSPEVNVLTVEDPVEYILPGVRQIKLNNKLGLEGALRSILRHDPDVVMVGEMRDRHTAELAIKLANTGHLTFSTLHTNDAASAVSRLYKMGIEPFLIAYAINLVVAQRLIRRLCPTCKVLDTDPDPILLKNLGFTRQEIEETPIYTEGHKQDCPTCKGLNFKGRRAVTEALYFSREIRHMIAESEGMLDELAIKQKAAEQGMMTLQDSARNVVLEGDTSILEMLRVVSTED